MERRAAPGASAALGSSDPARGVRGPRELGPALKFGPVYALVLLLSRGLHSYFGSRGLYLASGLAGLADVDAITLAAARLSLDQAPVSMAAALVLIAVASNTVVKTIMAWTAGGWGFARQVALGYSLALILGGLGLLLTWLR